MASPGMLLSPKTLQTDRRTHGQPENTMLAPQQINK